MEEEALWRDDHYLELHRMTGVHIDTLMGEGSNFAAPNNLLQLVDCGDFDLIAVGCGMLVNPESANKVREGRIDQSNN